MTKPISIRILFDIMIIIAIIQGWWFVALPLGIIGAWRYDYFLELVLAGFMYDSLFGLGEGRGAWGYSGTIVTIVLFIVVISFKKVARR